MKSVLLTRSLGANQETIEEISKYGLNFRYVELPLIKYKTLAFDDDILKNYSNIIITSKYAATVIAGYKLKHNVWAVGNTSKKFLEHNGLKVAYAGRNVDDLIQHFPTDLYERTIYLSSNEITQNLPNKITRHIIYNVEYLNELPLSIIKEFKNSIDFILLYSQNSAKTLIRLLNDNNLLEYLQDGLVLVISLKVANIVKPFFKNVIYCDEQNPNDIIKLLFENAKIH